MSALPTLRVTDSRVLWSPRLSACPCVRRAYVVPILERCMRVHTRVYTGDRDPARGASSRSNITRHTVTHVASDRSRPSHKSTSPTCNPEAEPSHTAHTVTDTPYTGHGTRRQSHTRTWHGMASSSVATRVYLPATRDSRSRAKTLPPATDRGNALCVWIYLKGLWFVEVCVWRDARVRVCALCAVRAVCAVLRDPMPMSGTLCSR